MKRLFLSFLIVFSLVLAGCGPKATPSESAATQPPASESVASPAATSGEKIVIRVWGHQNNSFNQAHQDI
ncbi:MAG: hypothetical protein ACP5QU_06815, partial [Anaerolineae bacterium]